MESSTENQPISNNDASSRSWVLSGGATILAVCFSVYHILYITHVFERLDINISAISHRAISWGLILVLIFAMLPFKKKSSRNRVPWWDWALIGLGVITCVYVILLYQLGWTTPRFHPLGGDIRDAVDAILSLVTILLILEASRRAMGLALPLVALCFFLYSLFCNYFPGFLQGRGYSLMRVSQHMYLWSEGVWGVALGVAAVTIVCYVIFGAFLSEMGAGEWFTDIALSLFGGVRGGPAKVSVFSSALFGMISGSTTANVMIDGVITIPMMKKAGFSANFAGAVEAVTSNGGQIMPPVLGAVAFIICEMLQIPYRQVVLAAIIPAFLYFFMCFLTIDFQAAIKGIKGLPRSETPPLLKTLKKGWIYILPIVAIIYFLLVVGIEAEISALYALGIFVALEIPQKGFRVWLRKTKDALKEGATGMLVVSSACACAGIIMGSLSLTGLGAKLSIQLLNASQGNMFLLLLLSAIACYILGMGMGSIPIYLVVAITVGPALIKFGIPPLAAHFFVFWWALTSFLTPPVAMAAYAAAGISGGDPFKTGFHAMRLGIGNYIIPFMFVYNPALILIGAPGQIIMTTIFCTIAAFAFAAGLNGYMITRLKPWEMVLLVAGACPLSITLDWRIAGAGLALIVLVVLNQMKGRRSREDLSFGERETRHG